MSDRKHQAELRSLLYEPIVKYAGKTILLPVVPGGGKSRLPGIAAERFSKFKIAWFVPRLSLAKQAAVGLQKDFGISIRESGNDINPSRGTRGFVTTHQALVADPELWIQELSRHSYIVVVDEAHHAKETRDGVPSSLANAIARLPFAIRLLMTGTLETNDNSLIYGVPYSATRQGYELDLESFDGHVIRYSRTEALLERAIVPIEFQFHEGTVSFEGKDGICEVALSDAAAEHESAALMTALKTEIADQLLARCLEHWQQTTKTAGGKLLIVTCDQSDAKKRHAELTRVGHASALAISDAPDALLQIERFKTSMTVNVLVTCQMAYEGLDVPEITHIACLTHIRSAPWIEQMLARAWRTHRGKTRCWAFVPKDPKMLRLIEKIRAEQEAVIPLLNQTRDGECGHRKDSVFIPIQSNLEWVHAELLDAGPRVDDEKLAAAMVAMRNAGWDGTDDELRAIIANKRQPAIFMQPSVKTVREEEDEIRRNIAQACNRANREDGRDENYWQYELKKVTKKSTTDMSLEELKRARTILRNMLAR